MWLLGNDVVEPPTKLEVEKWQDEQSSEVVIWVVGASDLCFGVTPAKVKPSPWQLEQLLTMPTWFIVVPAKFVN